MIIKNPETMDEAIGSVVKDMIAMSGLPREEIAGCIGVHPATLRTWLNGERRWTVINLMKIADFLGTDISIITNRARARLKGGD